jgi:hypothetical protein
MTGIRHKAVAVSRLVVSAKNDDAPARERQGVGTKENGRGVRES